jgi:hypothetical protein
MLTEEEAAVNKTIDAICKALEIKREIFEKTHSKLSNSQEHCEYVMAAQQGKLKKLDPLAAGPVKITKEKTMHYLKKQSEQAMNKVADMKSKQDALKNEKQDQVEATIDMLVEQARV